MTYTGLWFNGAGLNRALVFRNKLTITGSISLTASEGFTQKNLHRSHAENAEAMKKQTALYLENGVDVPRIGVMAAFGCNYQGDIAPAQVASTLEDGLAIAAEAGADIKYFSLADTMGWATPLRIERTPSEMRIPQLGNGGRTPSPRKLSPASLAIAPGMPKVAEMMMGAITFGSRWDAMMRLSRAPTVRAESIYSFSFSDNT